MNQPAKVEGALRRICWGVASAVPLAIIAVGIGVVVAGATMLRLMGLMFRLGVKYGDRKI